MAGRGERSNAGYKGPATPPFGALTLRAGSKLGISACRLRAASLATGSLSDELLTIQLGSSADTACQKQDAARVHVSNSFYCALEKCILWRKNERYSAPAIHVHATMLNILLL